MISNNVMEINNQDTLIFYRVACACGDNECDCDIIFEHDKNINDISINFYKNLYWHDYYNHDMFITRWLARLKLSLKILFTGNVKVQGEFLIQSEEHINNFIMALQEGKKKIQKNIKNIVN